MILIDANILIYATNRDAANHKQAVAWLEEVFATGETIGFSWSVLMAYLRLTTKPGLFTHPASIDQALGIVANWLAQPSARVVHPGSKHFEILTSLL